jgi:hypothetical protein
LPICDERKVLRGRGSAQDLLRRKGYMLRRFLMRAINPGRRVEPRTGIASNPWPASRAILHVLWLFRDDT